MNDAKKLKSVQMYIRPFSNLAKSDVMLECDVVGKKNPKEKLKFEMKYAKCKL